MTEKTKALKEAFPCTLPVMMGYLFLGIAFGVLLESKGYNFLWAFLMSTCIYAGSMQFITVNFLTGGVSMISIIFMSLVVNARNVFYGLSMLDRFKGMGKLKRYMMFSLTDETFSLILAEKVPDGVNEKWFLFFISLLNQIYWIVGSIIGAIMGSLLSFNIKGIDFSMTALFVVIFIEQWKSNKDHTPAITGVVTSIICLLIFGPSNFILPAMIFMVASLTAFRGRLEGGYQNEFNS